MKLDVIYNKSSQRMPELPDGCIDMGMTSPPYWGLRDYGEDVKEIWGGDADCEHEFNSLLPGHHPGQVPQTKKQVASGSKNSGQFCSKCNAWHGQLGLEPTFQLYLDHMLIVCAEIKRVLKKAGSLWLDMGDTYSSTAGGGTCIPTTEYKQSLPYAEHTRRIKSGEYPQLKTGVKPKCLLGIPWRLVLRLIDEQGWVLRNAGIWNKPNSMPSSTKDRLSNSYEFLFHFVKNTKPQYCWNEKTGLMADRKPPKDKQREEIDWHWVEIGEDYSQSDTKISSQEAEKFNSPRARVHRQKKRKKRTHWHSLGYWYDLDAIREPHTLPLRQRGKKSPAKETGWNHQFEGSKINYNPAGKNPGDVWRIPSQPRKDAHFATFPDKLCIKPILATCPAEICKKCGKARVRIVENKPIFRAGKKERERNRGGRKDGFTKPADGIAGSEHTTLGWTDCGCNTGWDGGVLLDPFAGRGTSLIMAKKLGRHYVGYELKKEYADMAERELEKIDPLFRRNKWT